MSIFLFSLFDCLFLILFFVCVLVGIVQLICRPGRVRLSFSLNSLNCISGLVLLCFLFRRRRPYDVTTTSNLPFVHSFMQFQLKCVRNVIFCS